MNILVRADSSSTVGTGHIMRLLVLVQEFANDNIFFATQDLENNINHKIIEAGYKLEILRDNSLDQLDSVVKKLSIDMLIIDHYDIDFEFEKEISKRNKNLKLFVLDDTYNRHFCDILLNHNIYADEQKYRDLVPKKCEIRCGSRYTLIRDEFVKAKKNPQQKPQTTTIFVAMGGADHSNINIDVIKIINEISKDIKIVLATTTANKNLTDLKEYIKEDKNIDLFIDSNEIAKLIDKSHFAIITPSVLANEISYLNLPFIAIKTAENQNEMYKYLKENGYNVLDRFDQALLKEMIIEMIGGINANFKI